MFSGSDTEANNGSLAQLLGGFQSVQALDQYETLAVHPHQDRCGLAVLEHAGSEFVDARLIKRGEPFDRHVDLVEREILALHHGGNYLARPALYCAGLTEAR